MIRKIMILAGLLMVMPAWAQVPVVTSPAPVTTLNGNASGTIAVTNTFQMVFVANPARKGCTIVDETSDPMWVTEALGIAGSTKTKAYELSSNTSWTFNCASNGVVLTGEIDITGTANDAFYAVQF